MMTLALFVLCLIQGATGSAPAITDPVAAELRERLIVPNAQRLPIRGRVIDGFGLPIAGATVHVWGAPTRGPRVRYATTSTSEAGAFAFEERGLYDPTRIVVSAEASGFVATSQRLARRNASGAIGSGTWTFPLEFMLLPGEAFEGEVVRPDGGSLITATLTHRTATTRVDSSGRFSVPSDLSAVVRFDVEGFLPLLTRASNGRDQFVMQEGRYLRGQVVDAKGNGLPGVRVAASYSEQLLDSIHKELIEVSAVSFTNGHFELGPLPDSVPLISVQDLRYESDPVVDLEEFARPIRLTARPALRLRARLRASDGEPIDAPYVVMMDGVNAGRRWHGNGHDYLSEPLIAALPSEGMSRVTISVRGYRPRTVEWREQRGVVDLGDVVMSRGRSVPVTLLDESDTPVVGAWLSIHGKPNQSFVTDMAGQAVIGGLLRGAYHLLVEVPGRHVHVFEIGATSKRETLHLLEPGRLIVRLVDGRRRPVEVGSLAVHVDQGVPGLGTRAGEFLPDGRVGIASIAPRCPIQVRTYVPFSVLTVEPLEPGETREVELRVGRQNIVYGRIVDTEGKPYDSVAVAVSGERSRVRYPVTNANGEYEVSLTGHGRFHVYVPVIEGLDKKRALVQLLGDTVVEKNLVYRRPGDYRAMVTYQDGAPVPGVRVSIRPVESKGDSGRFPKDVTGGDGRVRMEVAGGNSDVELLAEKEHHATVWFRGRFADLPHEIVMSRPAKVTLVVTDSDTREPIRPLSISFVPTDEDESVSPSASGEIPPGHYVITVTQKGYAPASVEVTLAAGESHDVDIAMVRSAPRDIDDVPLGPASSHTVRIAFVGTSGTMTPTRVHLIPRDRRVRTPGSVTNTKDRVRFEGVRAGRYLVRYEGRAWGEFEVSVGGPQSLVEIEHSIVRHRLSGQVSHAGRHLPNLEVAVLLKSGWRVATVKTNWDGRYTVRLTPGEYRLRCRQSRESAIRADVSVTIVGDSELDLVLGSTQGDIVLDPREFRTSLTASFARPAMSDVDFQLASDNRVSLKGHLGDRTLYLRHPRLEPFGPWVLPISNPGAPKSLATPELGRVVVTCDAAPPGPCWVSMKNGRGESVGVARVDEFPCRLTLPVGRRALLFEWSGDLTQIAWAETNVEPDASELRIEPRPAGTLTIARFGRTEHGVEWDVRGLPPGGFALRGVIPAPGFSTAIALPAGRFDWTLRTASGDEQRGVVEIRAGQPSAIEPSDVFRSAHLKSRPCDDSIRTRLELWTGHPSTEIELRSGHALHRATLVGDARLTRRRVMTSVPPRSRVRWLDRDLGWFPLGEPLEERTLSSAFEQYRVVTADGWPVAGARPHDGSAPAEGAAGPDSPAGTDSQSGIGPAIQFSDAAGVLRVGANRSLAAISAPGYLTRTAPEAGFAKSITLQPAASLSVLAVIPLAPASGALVLRLKSSDGSVVERAATAIGRCAADGSRDVVLFEFQALPGLVADVTLCDRNGEDEQVLGTVKATITAGGTHTAVVYADGARPEISAAELETLRNSLRIGGKSRD